MVRDDSDSPFVKPWRQRLHTIIFEADTPSGKLFDVLLLWGILLSVLAVMLESVEGIRAHHGDLLRAAEWVFTILFTIEYVIRIASVRKPSKYIFSFLGIIDLLSIVPTYLSLLFTDTQYLLVIRAVRLLRVFRILKLGRYLKEADVLSQALSASRHKITVFLGAVFTLVLIVGSLMHLIEGPEAGFTSIPKSVYWAVVTLTTVGYGDITPQSPFGQFISAIVMVLGYGIIAVPTGIVSVEISKAQEKSGGYDKSIACSECGATGHALDARFCKFCGGKL